jgi:hypothetical protein
MSDSRFFGFVLDPTAHGVSLTTRGKMTAFVAVMGGFAIIAGGIMYAEGSVPEVRPFVVLGGAITMLASLAVRRLIQGRERARVHEPRALKGLGIEAGHPAWVTYSARLEGVSERNPVGITDLRTTECLGASSNQNILRITIAPLVEGKMHHIAGIALFQDGRLVGRISKDEAGLFFLLQSNGIRRAIPLPLACERESWDVARTCVRNLRIVGAAVASRADLSVRLAIAYPKEGVFKWGLALGAIGGAIAIGLERRSRGKLEKLLEEGGLFDSHGSLVSLAEAHEWQIELV